MGTTQYRKEIDYTICPVGNATYLAVNNGSLAEDLHVISVDPVRLQTREPEHWKEHFTYQNDHLFREGGNVPPIWAKSRGEDVVLIGLNIIEQRQSIIVRKNSEIRTVADLKGRTIGIVTYPGSVIDFMKASEEQGFEIALRANGLTKDDVNWKIVEDPRYLDNKPSKGKDFSRNEGVTALLSGEVDAIYSRPTLPGRPEGEGLRVLYDIAYDQTALVPVNNQYPNVLTVSGRLAREEPRIVIEFLKSVLRAARWARLHRDEAEKLLAEQTYTTVEEFHEAFGKDFYQRLEPNFSTEGLKALQNRADFLYEHGYLESKVDIYAWADPSFLTTAQLEIEQEAGATA